MLSVGLHLASESTTAAAPVFDVKKRTEKGAASNCSFELGEHAEHLQKRPTSGRACVDAVRSRGETRPWRQTRVPEILLIARAKGRTMRSVRGPDSILR